MANRDMNSRFKPVIALAPATVTTSVNGVSIDTSNNLGIATFDALGFNVFVNGSVGDTLAVGVKSIEFDLQESNDNSTWNYVYDWEINVPYTQVYSGRGIVSTTTNTGGAVNPGCFFMATANSQLATGTVLRVSYVGSKRYVRIVMNTTGTTTGTAFFAIAALGYSTFVPVQGNLT